MCMRVSPQYYGFVVISDQEAVLVDLIRDRSSMWFFQTILICAILSYEL
jgi:hypothetical protein